jgi:DNA-binding transcriptional LysR family regulator
MPVQVGKGARLQLAWVQTFLAVHRSGSFTKAGEHLGLTQPAVTQHIKNLERALGRLLFKRTPLGAVPTEAAHELMHDVAPSIDNLDAWMRRETHPEASPRTVCLGGPVETVTTRILPALAHLVRRGQRLSITVGPSDELVERVLDRRLDIAVCTVRSRRPGVEVVPLVDDDLVLIAAPEVAEMIWRDARLSGLLQALGAYPLIARSPALPFVRRYWLSVLEVAPTREADLVVPDLRAVVAAVVAGAGVSVVPAYLCEQELQQGLVVAVRELDRPPRHTLHLVTRTGASRYAEVGEVQDALTQHAQDWC